MDSLVGRKFVKKTGGRQETRRILDVNYGGDVFYAYGPRLAGRGRATKQQWDAWAAKARELRANPCNEASNEIRELRELIEKLAQQFRKLERSLVERNSEQVGVKVE